MFARPKRLRKGKREVRLEIGAHAMRRVFLHALPQFLLLPLEYKK